MDSQGNALVLGRFTGTVDFDPGPGVSELTASSHDLFLAKYSPTLALMDVVDLGDIDLVYGGIRGYFGLAVDANDNIYVTGMYQGSSSCLSLSAVSTACDGQGEFLLPIETGTASFVAKISSSLQSYMWVNHASLNGLRKNASAWVTIIDIDVDAPGDSVYVVGLVNGQGSIGSTSIRTGSTPFISKLDATNGSFEWTNVTGLYESSVGSVSVDDTDPNAVYANFGLATARYDQTGNLIWQQPFGAYDLVADGGHVYLAGGATQRRDGATGQVDWSWGNSDVETYQVSVVNDDLFVIGRFDGSVALGTDLLSARGTKDAFVSHMDAATGQFVRSWRMGGEAGEGPGIYDNDGGIAAGPTAVYAQGWFRPPADFPNGEVFTAGTEVSRFLLKFEPAGDPTEPFINGFGFDSLAIEQGEPLDVGIQFLGTASGIHDPDGRVNSVAFYHDSNANRQIDAADLLLGVGSDGSDSWQITVPTSQFPEGFHIFLAQATYDGLSVTNTGVDAIEVVTPATNSRSYAVSESTAAGTVTSRSYLDTHASDNVYEAIKERKSDNRLRHQWTFDLTGVYNSFSVEAYHDSNFEEFRLWCDCGAAGGVNLLTVTKRADDDSPQTVILPTGVTGTVVVKVEDRYGTGGKLATVFVDEMYFDTSGAAALPSASQTATVALSLPRDDRFGSSRRIDAPSNSVLLDESPDVAFTATGQLLPMVHAAGIGESEHDSVRYVRAVDSVMEDATSPTGLHEELDPWFAADRDRLFIHHPW